MKKTLLVMAALCFGIIAAAQEEEAQYNQYGVKVETTPLVAESQDGFLVLRSQDNNYKI